MVYGDLPVGYYRVRRGWVDLGAGRRPVDNK